METPLQVTFRNMERTPAIEEQIEARVQKLETFCDRIVGCHVVVEAPHRRHRQGNQYSVKLQVSVPRREIVINRDPGRDEAHEDVGIAIRDAFSAAQRQLEDYVRELRGDTKSHAVPAHGRIQKLLDDFGFIETADQREFYFHANSVIGHPFANLEVGQEVRFVEEAGDEGPQATSIHLLGRHHHILEEESR